MVQEKRTIPLAPMMEMDFKGKEEFWGSSPVRRILKWLPR